MYYRRLLKTVVSPLLLRMVLIAGIGFLIVLMQATSVALADDEYKFDELMDELYDEKKKEFVEKFEKFKKEGLTAKEVESLTDQLLDVADDKIEGTGTDTLLKTMNKQAKNAGWVLDKKEDAEKLIDFVGDVYAMGSSDAPPDPVDAYKALSKGVELGAKLADKIPVLKVVAVPMMEAYAQAIKNGNDHIEAIDAATKSKNEIIELGWRSPDYGDELLAATEMEEVVDEEPTEEEIQWEADRVLRQAEYGERLNACRAEYNAYDKAANARSDAWKKLEAQKKLLKQNQQSATTRRHQYNDLIPNYKKRHTSFQNALENRDKEYARMERAQAEGNEQGYQARKANLQEFNKELASRKQTLHEDFEKINQKYSDYLEAKAVVAQARREYRSLLAAYKAIDDDFKKAKASFDTCMETKDACKSATGESPGDAWLGKWTASSIYTETTRVWDWWFEVQKACDGYQIQTHTKDPGKTEIVSISADQLEFLFQDALGTRITLTRNGNLISGTVQQPNNSDLPRGRVEGKRAPSPPSNPSR